ncbi:MAG: guanylate cyclase [Eggerthellaceae bacterium]|nr:guanylate cyclase [Eggerthellaceae bacterium]
MAVRLVRAIPAIIVLAVIAFIIFLVVQAKYSSNRAKEILIKVFTVFFIILGSICALACIYALIDRNEIGLDIALAFLILCLIGLGITLWCRHVFLKHNPHYSFKAQKAEVNEHEDDAKTQAGPNAQVDPVRLAMLLARLASFFRGGRI